MKLTTLYEVLHNSLKEFSERTAFSLWRGASVTYKQVGERVEEIHKMGSKLWVNTFWPSVCGGFGNDDDAAYDAADPFAVYQQYIDMGASMIQSDRPGLLIKYLDSIGRHTLK